MTTYGLSEAEAARLLAARGPFSPPATSRSLASIVRANVFTFFNLILAVFGGLTLVFGDWRDALFLGILVANSTIGITQELRAKRALDRLSAEVAPHATVVRDGEPRVVGVEEVVVGDLVRLAAGDGVVADGTLVESAGLSLDESILTGESRPAARGVGQEVRSGSYAVEGAGAFVVDAVGPDSYAQRIAGEARQFRHPRSPLERSLNRLLFVLVAVMIPLGTIFIYSLWQRDDPINEAVTTAVAGIVTLIPEGLILLASLTFAAAALQLARRGALAQQLNAIESLASVDTICLDKTGTLTAADLRVVSVKAANGGDPGGAAARGGAVRVELARAQPDARGDRDRGRRACGGGGRVRPVLVGAALERAAARRHLLRAGRAGAVPARPARGRGRARAGGGAPGGRVRHGDGSV